MATMDNLLTGVHDLVVARSRLGAAEDAGVTLGVGDPAWPAAWLPECGCDACDSGSADALGSLDQFIRAVVSGTFRPTLR